jgi:uncharacterized protein (TIGR02145 family)
VDAGVTGVTVNNITVVNAAVANQTAGTTAEIQTLANTGITTATVGNSTLTASTATVDADGSTTSTITLQAKDANNNNLSVGGLTVTMIRSGSSATLSSVTDNNDGTYTATIKNTTAETVTVTAAIGGSNVTDTADVSFTLPLPFATVVIGTQTWSASHVSIVPTAFNTLGTNYWTAYVGTHGSGDAADEDGYYYTWDAAMNVCPSGWRLPSDSDFATLEEAVVAGASNVDWENTTSWRGTTEGRELQVGFSSGFEAKLAGYRYTDGTFYGRGVDTPLWSSAELGGNAYRRYLYTSFATVMREDNSKVFGFSVRCLMD